MQYRTWPRIAGRGLARLLCGWAISMLAFGGIANAQDAWPNRPFRLVVPYPVGGTTDIVARQLAEVLGRELGQPVVVDNKPGAATNLGAESVVNAKPDGYTLLLGGVGQVLNPVFGPKPSFDLMSSLEAVGLVARVPFVIAANPKVPANNPRELLAAAKAAPGRLTISSAQLDLYVELLNAKAGIQLLHVPYKGGAPATTDAISGQVDMVYALVPVLLPHIQSGRLKPIAVTSAKRFGALPDVPGIAEVGVDYDVAVWYGVMAPAGTPRAILERLAAATQKSVDSAELGQKMRGAGAEPSSSTADGMRTLLKNELAFWEQVARALPQLVQK